MAAEIREAFPKAEVKLVGGSGGVFEVEVDEHLVFSKRRLGRHAEAGEVIGLMRDFKDR